MTREVHRASCFSEDMGLAVLLLGLLEAAKAAVARIRRQRLDAKIARCLQETAGDDEALLAEFAGVPADGL